MTENHNIIPARHIHEECGVFGIFTPQEADVASYAYYALYSLQHRGQESAGIVVNDDGLFRSLRDTGLVSEVFPPEQLKSLGKGTIAVGHVRYGTTGSDNKRNVQPILVNHFKGRMALAHNGNLTNSRELRQELESRGSIFQTTTDSEVIAYIIVQERLNRGSIEEAVSAAMDRIEGAYSLVLSSPTKLIAARDPHGFRPLCMGHLKDGSVVFASESCALDAIGADVLGINCSQGPAELRGLAARMLTVTDKPVMVQANAGLPRVDDDGNTVFDIQAPEYAEAVAGMIEDGVSVVGGCCGTTPTHMAALRTLINNHTPSPRRRKPSMSVTSAQTVVDLPCNGHKIAVIGERINPTGKKRLQQALRDGNLDYVVSQGISQQEQGADILDVNVGLPEIDEVKIIQQATEQLQGSTLLPLQIDSTDPAAVEAAVRRYAGKPIINSVNGKQQIMDEIFPLVAHYGTNVVGLTLDEGGIPDTAEARFAIAERIVAEAARYGIGPDRILIDCLVMTASTNQRQAEQILRAMSLCKERLGVKCALGVSNISFGLPARPLLGSVFLAAAFGAGLDAPIMNPGSKRFMDTVYSYRVLSVEDEGSTGYIERYAGWTDPYKIAANPAAAQAVSTDTAPAAGTAGTDSNDDPIRRMVVSGRKGEIAAETERLLADHDAMDLINNHFIPALDEVGVLFDQGKFFLPQLMASAEAARVGFDTIKRLMPAGEIADKGKICVATVKGDIHDIGKNIVKMLLDNYGYTVFDLGRDVDPQEVLKTVKERDIKLVGLSALMTTTVVAMEETIKLLHAEVPGVKIIVGGAVLTPEYAKQIGADYYAKDAAESARIAEEVFGQ